MSARDSAFESIELNIARNGYHVYVVTGARAPRFAYTIGLCESAGFELIFAGGSYFTGKDVKVIIDAIAPHAMAKDLKDGRIYEVERLGRFSLRVVDDSWVKELMLGALDYYGERDVRAVQIVPDSERRTVDVPDLSKPWDPKREPIWRWLRDAWRYPVSERSNAVTNLGALKGERITEVARWEVDQWELFAGSGPDVPQGDVRVVPLGTLLAIDPSLDRVTELGVGQALWRDKTTLEWHEWKSKA